ncbi:MAG TPA: deoxycytidine triphosphate deaminase [Candidatus Binatia bacterium]|nr:deoxycytidine triphosphate deaminase [Candidatus Binatia bacterium]
MPVWSAETLISHLEEVVFPATAAAVDGAAYTLKVGNEVYVSPSSLEGRDNAVIRQLQTGQDIVIPPGQYAFLVTAETVMVPNDAMALISIKARIKWRGLVNVSGFHVDPGYSGKLIFGVFNAGPSTIHLRSGEDCFLIWFLSLDHPTKWARQGGGHDGITSDIVGPISGEWKTIDMLDSRLDKLEHEQVGIRATLSAVMALGIALVAGLVIYLLHTDISVGRTALPASPQTAPTATRGPGASSAGVPRPKPSLTLTRHP